MNEKVNPIEQEMVAKDATSEILLEQLQIMKEKNKRLWIIFVGQFIITLLFGAASTIPEFAGAYLGGLTMAGIFWLIWLAAKWKKLKAGSYYVCWKAAAIIQVISGVVLFLDSSGYSNLIAPFFILTVVAILVYAFVKRKLQKNPLSDKLDLEQKINDNNIPANTKPLLPNKWKGMFGFAKTKYLKKALIVILILAPLVAIAFLFYKLNEQAIAFSEFKSNSEKEIANSSASIDSLKTLLRKHSTRIGNAEKRIESMEDWSKEVVDWSRQF